MRICIPTEDDRGLESRVFGHFGSAPFFTLVDVDDNRIEVIRNSGEHGGHHSCHHIDVLKGHQVGAVVCGGIGKRAHSALAEARIDVLGPVEGTVSEILGTVRAGTASKLSGDATCGGGHGHGHSGQHGQGCRHRVQRRGRSTI